MLEISKRDMFGPRGFYVEQGARFAPRPEMQRMLDDFAAACGRNGVRVEGTRHLPDWHASAGGKSWVFVDELVVR